MEFLKNFFKDDDKVVGLCGFEDSDDLKVFIPKCEPSHKVYKVTYKKNFFLM